MLEWRDERLHCVLAIEIYLSGKTDAVAPFASLERLY